MNVFKQLSVILAVCIAGEAVVSILPFAFPGSVASLLLMAVLLLSNVIKEKQIGKTGDFLLSNMAIVFVPFTVGVLEDLDVLKGQAAGFLIVVVLSLVLTFVGTYAAVRIVQVCMDKLSKGKRSQDE